MEISRLFGFGIKKEELGFLPAKLTGVSSYFSSAPGKKLEKLRGLFKNNYKDYQVFDKSLIECDGANFLIPHDGRLNFINQKHKELFYLNLKNQTNDNSLYARCLYFYRKSDNCLLLTWVNPDNTVEFHNERKKIADIFKRTLIESISGNLIIFPYLNEDFAQWPESEKTRFYIFLKNTGGAEAVKEFDASVAQDAERKEKSFFKWARGKLDIVSGAVNNINIPENLFARLDEIILPKIINMPHDPNHPEADARYMLLCDYAYFIVARNAINPVSWLAGLASFHKLPELWDKIVSSAWKMEGPHEDFALLLGQLIGTALAIPVAVKGFRIISPKALTALKAAAQKAKVPFQMISRIIKKVDKAFELPEKPRMPRVLSREQGRILFRKKHLERAKIRERIKMPKRPEKIKQPAGEAAKIKKYAPVMTYTKVYRTGKLCFEKYEKCLRALANKIVDEKRVTALNKEMRRLREKARQFLERSEKLNPTAQISFENNWRLCILKIRSRSWHGALSRFLKMIAAYNKIGQYSQGKLRVIKNVYNAFKRELGAYNFGLNEEVRNLSVKINEVEKIINREGTRIAALEKTVDALLDKMSKLKTRTAELEMLKVQYTLKSAETDALQGKLKTFERNLSNLAKDTAERKLKSNKSLKSIKKSYREAITEVKAKIEKLEKERREISEEIIEKSVSPDEVKKQCTVNVLELDVSINRLKNLKNNLVKLRSKREVTYNNIRTVPHINQRVSKLYIEFYVWIRMFRN